VSTTEDQAEQRLQATGVQLVTTLQALARGLVLYDPNNAAVLRLIGNLETCTQEHFKANGGADLRLQVMKDEVFFCGRLLKVDLATYERAVELAALFQPFELGDFVFTNALTRDQIENFVTDFAETARSKQNRFRPGGYGAIQLGRCTGSAIASFRFEPDRLAVWLYGSLIDLVERLYDDDAVGGRSLLQLKRTLQLIIDNVRTHSAIYQLLGAVQDPAQKPSRARMRVSTATELVGFGVYLDLPGTEIMTLALAGVLGGLRPVDAPAEAAVQELQRFGGLGEAAMPLALLLYDARAARKANSRSAGMPGRILAMIEEYTAQIHCVDDHEARSPSRILSVLAEGKVPWIPAELGRAFRDYKGSYPMGSLVTLRSGRTAVVVGRSEHPAHREHPRVAILSVSGELGARVDLAQGGDAIVAAPAPERTGVRVALLDRRSPPT